MLLYGSMPENSFEAREKHMYDRVHFYRLNANYDRVGEPIEIGLKENVVDLSGLMAYDPDLVETWQESGVQDGLFRFFPKDGLRFLQAIIKLGSRGIEFEIVPAPSK